MPVIPLYVGENYSEDLRVRLDKYGISQGELARELAPKLATESETDPEVALKSTIRQLSRWFNTPLQPSHKNIVKIEQAILAIRARKAKKGKKRGKDA